MRGPSWWRRVPFLRLVSVVFLTTLLLASPASGQRAIPFAAIWFLGFNVTQPPFDNVTARRAVASAVDRARLASADDNNPANSLDPPGCLAHNPGARPHPYNPEQAKALLAQSGIKLDELGQLGLWYLSALRRGNSQAELQILTANLSTIGLEVSLREFGSYSAFERFATLPVVKMSYWGVGLDMPVCAEVPFLATLAHSRAPFNHFGYRNADVDALITRAINTGDRATKIRLFQEAEQKVLDDAVIVPVWWYVFR